ncbi:hypothetical protein PLANPX_5410 [Lacipirellula parvula]|uniref:Uncharacterized protein n=1 Tax=Lacipirellula parvula TaxID=2650471 RepID=A0A5K7XH82_9BACT|nr:hypothetical protein PLANPX_5410 [Lacipirellula parvula]
MSRDNINAVEQPSRRKAAAETSGRDLYLDAAWHLGGINRKEQEKSRHR